MLALSLIRRCWWVAAVLAVACLAPTRASAGCGGHSGGFYTLIDPEPQTATAEPPVPAPAPPPPCHGPNCSGVPLRDSFPVPPTTAVPTQVKEQVRCFVLLGGEPPQPTFDRDSAHPRPIRRASSVFHPPRLG